MVIMGDMNDFIEDLKKYFENTPREKVLEDWDKTESFDNIGPSMDELINHTNKIYNMKDIIVD